MEYVLDLLIEMLEIVSVLMVIVSSASIALLLIISKKQDAYLPAKIMKYDGEVYLINKNRR